ncbi:3-oxoacyl-[acyl-carrier-protein] reductase FabG-like isoform X2 [Dermacentor variabilis]|uniref:3-oxoacyl-[acyl-carrier-protein] reductase FabG-like isoform X2 n=1 Tax=Dermacentor variabilis TaxID=34621 RepID=UPI003F5BAACB
MQKLKDKVALVTGASSGIGEATALHFASLGSWLSLTARNLTELQRVAQECHAKGVPEEKVNNAGIYLEGSTDSPSLDNYDQLMNVNLRGPIQVLRCALPYLRQVKGNVVNVSSVVSLRAAHGGMFYSISKAGLDQLTKCTALENAQYGVRVNSVNPGVIATNMGRRPGESKEDHFERQTKAMAHAHLLGRLGTMDEVACAIAFLASDEASFITGHALPVDGGHLLMTPLDITPPDPLKQ